MKPKKPNDDKLHLRCRKCKNHLFYDSGDGVDRCTRCNEVFP